MYNGTSWNSTSESGQYEPKKIPMAITIPSKFSQNYA